MKIKTHRIGLESIGLEVMKADSDGDIYIGTKYDGFYLDKRDVPRLIQVLKWAVRDTTGGT